MIYAMARKALDPLHRQQGESSRDLQEAVAAPFATSLVSHQLQGNTEPSVECCGPSGT